MAERKKLAKVDIEGETLTFSFDAGGSIVVGLTNLTPEMVRRAALHGLEQKIRDSYAGAEPAEALGFAQKTLDAVLAGQWTIRREAGAPKEEPIDLLARAIMAAAEAKGWVVPTFEKAKANLEGMDKSARAKLRNSPTVAAALATIKEQSDAPLEAFLK